MDTSFAERIVRSYPVQQFSAVVVGELATHADKVGVTAVEMLLRRAGKRVFAPTVRDWKLAGDDLRERRPRRQQRLSEGEQLRLARMQNDALIAVSAWSRGASVVTCNGADFVPLRDFFNSLKGQTSTAITALGSRPRFAHEASSSSSSDGSMFQDDASAAERAVSGFRDRLSESSPRDADRRARPLSTPD